MRKLLSVMLLCCLVTGCSFTEKPKVVTGQAKMADKIEAGDIAYQFRTDRGQIITVAHDLSYTLEYTTPSVLIDNRYSRVPIEVHSDGFFAQIGFLPADVEPPTYINFYKHMYLDILDALDESSDGVIVNDNLRSNVVSCVDNIFPNKTVNTQIVVTGKDLDPSAVTTVSCTTVDYSDYSLCRPFNLPIVSAIVPLRTGEYLCVQALATKESGYWLFDDFPNIRDLLNGSYGDSDLAEYSGSIIKMQEGYNKALQFLGLVMDDIFIEDKSNDYVVVSLDSGKFSAKRSLVNTAVYDKYSYVRLPDAIYIVFEKNGMHGVECLAGNSTHELSTDWDEYDTFVVDEASNTTYNFTWNAN